MVALRERQAISLKCFGVKILRKVKWYKEIAYTSQGFKNWLWVLASYTALGKLYKFSQPSMSSIKMGPIELKSEMRFPIWCVYECYIFLYMQYIQILRYIGNFPRVKHTAGMW